MIPLAAIIPPTHLEPLILLPVAFLSLLTLTLALRGRKVDDHPHCRKCKFDLFLQPPATTRCPECGSSLSLKKSIRQGQRQLNSRPFTIALFVLLICSADAALHTYHRAKTITWIHYAPDWWLQRQADSKHADSRDSALAELTRRILTGQLSPKLESALVTKALAYQADPSRPWDPGWGDIVQATFQCRRLPPTLWDQYELNAVQLHLEPAARTMRACDPVLFKVVQGPDRTGHRLVDDKDEFLAYLFFDHQLTHDATTRPAYFEEPIRSWAVDQPPDEANRSAAEYLVRLRSIAWPLIDPDVTPQFDVEPPPGKHHAQMSLMIRAARFTESMAHAHFHGCPKTITMDCDWTMAASPHLSHDPSLWPAVLSSLTVTDLRFERLHTGSQPKYDGWSVYFTFDCKSPPIDMAYDVFAHIPSDGDDYYLTSLYLPRGKSWHFVARFDGQFWNEKMKDDKISVHLVPNPHLTPIGATEVWDQSVRFTPGSPTTPFDDHHIRIRIYGPAQCIYMKP